MSNLDALLTRKSKLASDCALLRPPRPITKRGCSEIYWFQPLMRLGRMIDSFPWKGMLVSSMGDGEVCDEL